MVSRCPQCGYENPAQSAFCVRCGTTLQPATSSQPTHTAASNPPTGGSQPTYLTPGSGNPNSQQMAQASFPSGPSYPAPTVGAFSDSSSPNSQQFAAGPAYPSYDGGMGGMSGAMQPGPYGGQSANIAQMGTTQGSLAVRRAFAGHGTLIMHHSWLLNGRQVQAGTARSTVMDIMGQRGIAGVQLKTEQLSERGVMMEQREYASVQRNNSTVFIYVAPAGQDLYISRATTVQPPISLLRAIIVCVCLFIVFFGPFIVGGILNNMASSSSGYSGLANPAPILAGLLFVFAFIMSYVPVLLFLLALLVGSIWMLAVEKDFWLFFRQNRLNDFQMDDIMVLEHSTDDSVRTAMQQLQLDANQITPPPQGYRPKQRIRII